MYEICTTLRPCVDSDEVLERVNPILLNVPNGFSIKIFNVVSDLPRDSRFLSCLVDGYEKQRPLLSDYIKETSGEYIVVSNADVLLPDNLERVFSLTKTGNFKAAATRRYDVPYEIIRSEKVDSIDVRRNFKIQSKRTIDCFVLNREFIRVMGDCMPGTVGFDNAILSYCFKNASDVVDFSEFSLLLHCHHEDFRIPFRYNLILNYGAQYKFSSGRKVKFSPDWHGGCLSQSKHWIDKDGVLRVRKYNVPQVNLKAESLRIKLINYYEKASYIYNKLVWRLAKSLHRHISRKISVRLISLYGNHIMIIAVLGDKENVFNQGYEMFLDSYAQKIVFDVMGEN